MKKYNYYYVFAAFWGSLVFMFPLLSLTPYDTTATITTYYVAIAGDNFTGDGTYQKPFRTIQRAIDATSDGDTVVVLEGRYTGAGNIDLNFEGKAVTVQSRAPDNITCVQATIIDAEGKGTLVKFINDEGPESIFQGFTLVAGNTSLVARGVPGIIELSVNANPSTKNLRIEGFGVSPLSIQPSQLSTTDNRLIWYGTNPFHQPAVTTNYYGSGDIDNNGIVTQEDVALAQSMASGWLSPTIRADVDGSGNISSEDVRLISETFSGNTLPAWWNQLTNTSERNAWIDRLMEIDQTNRHPYTYWWVCANFARQTFIHTSFYRDELYNTFYNGGPTIFNVPMYIVHIQAPGYPGHAINAILVGDNPLDFDSWRFIEPQTDGDVQVGGWNMPYSSTVQIGFPLSISDPGNWFSDQSFHTLVAFFVDESGWRVLEYSSELVLTRPAVASELPDNRSDSWSAKVLDVGSGWLLFEQVRDDLTYRSDVYLAELPFGESQTAKALTMSSEYSRLLDVFVAEDGTIHLLWTGKPNYHRGVFYGKLDVDSARITEVTRVSTGSRHVYMGRVIVTPLGDSHIFWLEGDVSALGIGEEHPYPTGVYWTKKVADTWQNEQNLTGEFKRLSWSNGSSHNHNGYRFDVALVNTDTITLVWADPEESYQNFLLHQLDYNGQWAISRTIESLAYNDQVGLDMAVSPDGILHLVNWAEEHYYDWDNEAWKYGRRDLTYRTYDDGIWSPPEIVDSHGGFAQMTIGEGDTVYLIWERENDGPVTPVWNQFSDGRWNVPQVLASSSGADTWNPTVRIISETLMFAWTTHEPDRVAIETQSANPLPPPVDIAFASSIFTVSEKSEVAPVTVALTTVPGLTVTVSYSTSNRTAVAGKDYVTATGVLTFGLNEMTKTFTVPIIDDIRKEITETIHLILGNPTNAFLGSPVTATLVIVDDDEEYKIYLPVVCRTQ